jgi:hypothetical protein
VLLAIAVVVAMPPRTSATPIAAVVRPAAEFAVVVSSGVGIDGLTFDELRRIFLFKRTVWRPGQTINVLLPDTGLPSRDFLLRQIYRMSDVELRRFILERIFQAEIDLAPKVVGSDGEAIAFAKSGRSILAIVAADAPGIASAKVLRIDGRLPGEPGYALMQK